MIRARYVKRAVCLYTKFAFDNLKIVSVMSELIRLKIKRIAINILMRLRHKSKINAISVDTQVIYKYSMRTILSEGA